MQSPALQAVATMRCIHKISRENRSAALLRGKFRAATESVRRPPVGHDENLCRSKPPAAHEASVQRWLQSLLGYMADVRGPAVPGHGARLKSAASLRLAK